MAFGRYSFLLALAACGGAPQLVLTPATPAVVGPAPEQASRDATVSASPAPSPPPLAERELVTQSAFFEALRAHDPTALAALYSPDATVDLGLGPAALAGPEAIAALATTLFRAFPDAKVQWATLLQSGDTIAMELAWTGTHLGAFGEHAPTKRVLGAAGLLVETFTPDGLFASQRLYFDSEAPTTDLSPRLGKPRAFEGLPTRQTLARDATPAGRENTDAMTKLERSLASGTLEDPAGLGNASSQWREETKRRLTEGKGAIPAWLTFVAHSLSAGSQAACWHAGDLLALEWGGTMGAAELLRFQDGHLASVHSYRRVPVAARH